MFLVCHYIDPSDSHQSVVVHGHEAEEVVLIVVGRHRGDLRKGEAVIRPLHGRTGVETSRDRQSQGAAVGVSRVLWEDIYRTSAVKM